ncbi:MAG: ATP-binding protein [Candidatus Dormibacteria bacterium]
MAWYQSLRWRLTLTFVGLLAILLIVAGGIEYGLLQGAILSSRGQSLSAAFKEGRELVTGVERARLHHGLAPLPTSTLARHVARALAEAGFSDAVYSPQDQVLATAAPDRHLPGGVVTGQQLPHPSGSQLVAAANFDTVIGPTELGQGPRAFLAELEPLTGPLGHSLGAVEVAEPYSPIASELTTAATVLGVGGAAVLLLALALGLWLTSRGLGPLRRLTHTAQALGRGDLSQRSGLPSRSDEVGELARVFDEMAAAVEHTVSEREAAEIRMRQFIADASHELRTPLTAIKGYLDVLQRDSRGGAKLLPQALPAMSREAERMRSLILDLLTLARSDRGRLPEPQAVEVRAVLGELLGSRPQAAQARLEEGAPVVALADPESLRRILTNLEENAELHGGGATIRWTVAQNGSDAEVRCRDQGPGIGAADLDHVFERFFRTETSRSRHQGGSGLGLAIVQSLVEAQGGRVSVTSNPNDGTVFTVVLPAAAAAQGDGSVPGAIEWQPGERVEADAESQRRRRG